jgi:hypothetical protein
MADALLGMVNIDFSASFQGTGIHLIKTLSQHMSSHGWLVRSNPRQILCGTPHLQPVLF